MVESILINSGCVPELHLESDMTQTRIFLQVPEQELKPTNVNICQGLSSLVLEVSKEKPLHSSLGVTNSDSRHYSKQVTA